MPLQLQLPDWVADMTTVDDRRFTGWLKQNVDIVDQILTKQQAAIVRAMLNGTSISVIALERGLHASRVAPIYRRAIVRVWRRLKTLGTAETPVCCPYCSSRNLNGEGACVECLRAGVLAFLQAGLPTQVANILARQGHRTLADLENVSDECLLSYRNMGFQSVRLIRSLAPYRPTASSIAERVAIETARYCLQQLSQYAEMPISITNLEEAQNSIAERVEQVLLATLKQSPPSKLPNAS